MWLRLYVSLVVCLTASAHVQLLYPPATLNLDFLDTFRTSGICGHEASGAEQTEEWKLPMYDANTVTEFQAGSNVTVSWLLHYAHQGGWLFELYNGDGELTSTWNNTNHWDCVSDSTQQNATLTMPETTCEGCVLRLRRQALEWGRGYRFHSCAQVNIVEEVEDCNGCSGHGRCVRGACRCERSVTGGFWYGDYCEKQDECDEDEHCGEGGVCVDSGNITPPGKQCYCKTGWWGPEIKPIEGSHISSRNCSRRTKMSLGNPEEWADQYDFEYESAPEGNFKLYYTVDLEKEEIEFAIRARTSNWAAFGFRPNANGERPTVLDRIEALGSEEAPGRDYGIDLEEYLDVKAEPGSEGKETDSGAEEPEEKDTDSGAEEPEEKDTDSGSEEPEEKDTDSGSEEPEEKDTDSGSEEPEEKDTDSGSEEPAEKDTDSGSEEPEEKDTDSGSEEPAEEDTDSGSEEPAEEGSKRRLLEVTKRMPAIQGEASFRRRPLHRSLLQDSEGGGEGDGEGDGEGGGSKEEEKGDEDDLEKEEEEEDDSESEQEDNGTCKDGDPTTTLYDEGYHDIASSKRRRLQSMPFLQAEKMVDPITRSGRFLKQEDSKSEGDTDEDDASSDEEDEEKDKDAEGEGDTDTGGEGDTDTGGEGDTDTGAEGDTDTGAEGDAEKEEKEEKFAPELIGFNSECENVATTTKAHPMINQDIYVVYGKSGMFRIQDSFTPSRAKPLPDAFYGGEDGVIDAIGEEDDGYTNVKFRRKLSTIDGTADYCILEDVNYLVVYAYGQPSENYTHIPDSGLETGRASNKDFYGEDELKFHGGGIGTSYEGRGVLVGSLDFFTEPSDEVEGGDCVESTMDGYQCMQEELNGNYILHWNVEDDGISFACQTTGTGWVAIGWPETPRMMIGSHAVIGLGGDIGSVIVFELQAKAPSGIVESNSFEIYETSIEQDKDSSVLKFKRLFDDEFTGEGEIDLVIAFNPEANEIVYHGFESRGGIKVTFSP